jgi:hypothetical protein
MKMKIYFAAMIVACMGLASCSSGDENKAEMMAKSIEYDVVISNRAICFNDEDCMAMWFKNNIEQSTRIPYLELLFAKAEKGELKITTADGKEVDSASLKGFFYSYDTVSMVSAANPDKKFDTVIANRRFDVNKVAGLKFREEWTYDPATLKVSKKVKAIAPFRMYIHKDTATGTLYTEKGKPMFWMEFGEKMLPSYIITNRIMYTVELDKNSDGTTITEDAPLIKGYLNQLIHFANVDSIFCYTYRSGDMPDSLLSVKDIEEMTNSKNCDVEKLSLRFTEQWVFDYQTGAMEKRVVGVTPILACYSENGQLKGYKPLFTTYFDDVWMPFGRKLELQKRK